eukprot:1504667-Alexandrium_andersonii.AAC.1
MRILDVQLAGCVNQNQSDYPWPARFPHGADFRPKCLRAGDVLPGPLLVRANPAGATESQVQADTRRRTLTRAQKHKYLHRHRANSAQT